MMIEDVVVKTGSDTNPESNTESVQEIAYQHNKDPTFNK